MKIESGIEIPKRISRGKWQRLCDDMNVGDSVLLTHKEAHVFRATMTRLGFKAVIRTEDKEQGLVRVWKCEGSDSDSL